METGDVVTLPITPATFWTAVGVAAIGLAILAVYGLLSGVKPEKREAPLTRLQAELGLDRLPTGIFAAGAVLWVLILIALFLGLLWTIASAAFHGPALIPEGQTALRFILISLAALTATLGAVVALPLTLIRVRLTRQQTDTAEEALFNDKINAAATDLAARRQVTRVVERDGTQEVLTEWQDDLVTRAAAIDRLEGLAQERPDTAARVARQLSIYVRELSRDYPAQDPPEGATPTDLRGWPRGLSPTRPDMEKAAQSLGRLQRIEGAHLATSDIDLRGANLQSFDLNNLSFVEVRLDEARLEGANLSETHFEGAQLFGAHLEGAYLGKAHLNGAHLGMANLTWAISGEAHLEGAHLGGAQLAGAMLSRAHLEGVKLVGARMDENTFLTAANLIGAAVKKADTKTIAQLRPFWDVIFADGSVPVSPDDPDRPAHWPTEELNWPDFRDQWHAWQATLPDFDPSWRRD